MSQETENSTVFMQEDLASLACHAALDLDDLLLDRTQGVESIAGLKVLLMDSLRLKDGEHKDGQGYSMVSLDPATVIAMRYALSNTRTNFCPTTTQEIVKEADTLIKKLGEIAVNPSSYVSSNREGVKALRDLCLALSRQATSRVPAFQDRLPKHPFRR